MPAWGRRSGELAGCITSHLFLGTTVKALALGLLACMVLATWSIVQYPGHHGPGHQPPVAAAGVGPELAALLLHRGQPQLVDCQELGRLGEAGNKLRFLKSIAIQYIAGKTCEKIVA